MRFVYMISIIFYYCSCFVRLPRFTTTADVFFFLSIPYISLLILFFYLLIIIIFIFVIEILCDKPFFCVWNCCVTERRICAFSGTTVYVAGFSHRVRRWSPQRLGRSCRRPCNARDNSPIPSLRYAIARSRLLDPVDHLAPAIRNAAGPAAPFGPNRCTLWMFIYNYCNTSLLGIIGYYIVFLYTIYTIYSSTKCNWNHQHIQMYDFYFAFFLTLFFTFLLNLSKCSKNDFL